MGTLAIADVAFRLTGEVVTVASMYGAWESPPGETGSRWIYADASVHRLILSLSALIGSQKGHKLIAAGDLNVLYGCDEEDSCAYRGSHPRCGRQTFLRRGVSSPVMIRLLGVLLLSAAAALEARRQLALRQQLSVLHGHYAPEVVSYRLRSSFLDHAAPPME